MSPPLNPFGDAYESAVHDRLRAAWHEIHTQVASASAGDVVFPTTVGRTWLVDPDWSPDLAGGMTIDELLGMEEEWQPRRRSPS